MSERYPIHDLIETQLKEIGVRRGELALRCGFKNVSIGVRRIDEICHGDIDSWGARMVLDALPAALEINKSKVDAALRETAEIWEAQQNAEAAREATWRASFTPCAYLLGTETRPSSITMYGMTGGAERWLTIPLDTSRPPVTFAVQALAFVKETPAVRFHGSTTGFIVNYMPDSAIRFDLHGAPVENYDRAYSPGHVEMLIGRRNLSAGSFAKLLGIEPDAYCE